jgi:cystathionine beta-synthase
MIGSLTEDLLLRRLASGEPLDTCAVGEIQGAPFPVLETGTPTQEAYPLLSDCTAAVAVMHGNNLEGIVTKSDLLEFWAHQRHP